MPSLYPTVLGYSFLIIFFVQSISQFLSELFLGSICYLNVCFFISQQIGIFQLFVSFWFLDELYCGQRECAVVFCPLRFAGTALWARIWSLCKNVLSVPEKMCDLQCFIPINQAVCYLCFPNLLYPYQFFVYLFCQLVREKG